MGYTNCWKTVHPKLINPNLLSDRGTFGPGRKLGDLGDVGDLGELSPSYSSPSFRVGPICTTRKLGDVWKSI